MEEKLEAVTEKIEKNHRRSDRNKKGERETS